ncbi:MAG: hypothetical protein HC839_03385 [Leptolyngbyaceae cyanobacterium RM2_2_21]|nr:hypothetical protein [Leptolyngbyaceae cyanobacterium RM2_2_21]
MSRVRGATGRSFEDAAIAFFAIAAAASASADLAGLAAMVGRSAGADRYYKARENPPF